MPLHALLPTEICSLAETDRPQTTSSKSRLFNKEDVMNKAAHRVRTADEQALKGQKDEKDNLAHI